MVTLTFCETFGRRPSRLFPSLAHGLVLHGQVEASHLAEGSYESLQLGDGYLGGEGGDVDDGATVEGGGVGGGCG